MKPIVYDRHAKKRMKERGVTEEETEIALRHPVDTEPSMKGRMNTYAFSNGRYLRITWKDESARLLVITVTIRKKPFKE